MAERSTAKGHKRLSVWAATEPLPVPLPPPARRLRPTDASVTERSEAHGAHRMPPDPHVADATRCESLLEDSSKHERSLRSAGILAALAMSAILVAGLGWLEIHEPGDFHWPIVKSIVLAQILEPMTAEDDLPYVTVVPLVPNHGAADVAERDTKTEAKEAARVTLSNLKITEPLGAKNETQRR
jgi:hypothetical protein